MIHGVVVSRRATVIFDIRGEESTQLTVEAIVDTGFTEFLTLPSALIDSLGLVRRDTLQIVLADGSQRWADEFSARVYWHGAWRRIPVQASEGDVLLGMSLMEDNMITIHAAEGGEVAIAGDDE